MKPLSQLGSRKYERQAISQVRQSPIQKAAKQNKRFLLCGEGAVDTFTKGGYPFPSRKIEVFPYCSSVQLHNKLYIFGYEEWVHYYPPKPYFCCCDSTGCLDRLSSMKNELRSLVFGGIPSFIVAMSAGQTSTKQRASELYHVSRNKWRSLPPRPATSEARGVCVLLNEKAYCLTQQRLGSQEWRFQTLQIQKQTEWQLLSVQRLRLSVMGVGLIPFRGEIILLKQLNAFHSIGAFSQEGVFRPYFSSPPPFRRMGTVRGCFVKKGKIYAIDCELGTGFVFDGAEWSTPYDQ